jgi:L-ascorbate 6-phosphate lactonase
MNFDHPVPHGQLAVWSLGQLGVVIKGGDTRLIIDPYLSDSIREKFNGPGRMFPAPVLPEALTWAEHVLATHEHLDHTDIDTLMPIAAVAPRARFYGTTYTVEMLTGAGLTPERAQRVDPGVSFMLGDARITPTPAAHYGDDVDPVKGHRWLGFMIELNGVTLWHSGDTLLFPKLMHALQPWRGKVDVMCVPVNGRDYWREQFDILGNMDGTEALDLAKHLGADVLIPMHNDLFAENHVSPAVLAEYQDRKHPRQKYHWLQPGELYVYVKGG